MNPLPAPSRSLREHCDTHMGVFGDRPEWDEDGADWPNRRASRFVEAGGLRWHVQDVGEGPCLLLIHGTGAASHSWRDVVPLLSPHFRVIVPDLPGHGFTAMPARGGLSLPGMTRLLSALLAKLDVVPDVVVGHSAGAAILISLALEGHVRPACIVAVNGALLPIRGATIFGPLARLLFLNPVAPRLFAFRARDRRAVSRLIEGTGSRIDDRGLALYQRLFRRSGHVAATLGMMAEWDLEGLHARLPRLSTRVVLAAATGDRAIPPADARSCAVQIPDCQLRTLRGGGHLVHEELPRMIAALILRSARAARR
jgi:magnesium chelatase accessory protein